MPETTVAGEIPAYNEYYNFTKKQAVAYVDEQTAGINHTADEAQGTYYIQCPSTGWKNSGKETHITQFPTEAVEGYDYNVNGYTDGRAWFSATHNATKLPGYLTIQITDEKIDLKFYQISGAKLNNTYNGINYAYAPEIKDLNMTRTLIDTLTINKADRT